MAFTTGARASSWNAPSRVLRTSNQRRAASKSDIRKPQIISPGLIGGSIYISIYQGTALALTDGPFTVGDVYGSYDFYCSFSLATYQFSCANTSPVFAPYGNDTFFVTMYDSHKHVLAITPGMPGTNFYGTAPTPYTVTSAGYPSPITIHTAAVVSSVAIDAPTPCVDPSFTGLYVSVDLLDGGGFPIFGPLATPVTLSTNGNFGISTFQLVSPYSFGSASSFTLYDTSQYQLELAATSPGAQGGVSVSGQGTNVGINTTALQSMSLIAVNRLALSPSASGLTMLGLVDSPAATYVCGTLPIATYDTATPVTFANPVAIGRDDLKPGVAIVDNVSGTTFVDAVDLFRASFGFGFYTYTFENAMPVVRGSIPGANPLDVAVSPIGLYPSGGGNHKIYVLNGDGSIYSIDTTTSAVSTVASSGSISGPNSIDVLWNDGGAGDYVFATSSNANSIYEVAFANTAPSGTPVSLVTGGNPFSASSTSAGIFADNFSGSGTFGFLAYDPTGNVNVLVSCPAPNCVATSFTYLTLSSGVGNRTGAGLIGGAYFTGTPFFLAGNGTQMVEQAIPGLGAGNTTFAFGAPVTRILSTYDGAWSGIGYGGAFVFNPMLGPGATVYSPSLTGTYATIVSP